MGDQNVKYSDFVSVKSEMTIMVMLSGGSPLFLQPPFMVFQNPTSNYPIMGVPDNVVGVSFRTQPHGSMDRLVFLEWLSERRAIKKLIHYNRGVIYGKLWCA